MSEPLRGGARRRGAGGFTLLELIVTISIAALLAGLAVPSFIDMVRSNQHVSATNTLLGALNLTRSEAVKRSARVTLCAGADRCGGGGYHTGWTVYADLDASGAFEPGSDELIRVGAAMAEGFTASGSAQVADYVSYHADGIAKQYDGSPQYGTVSICRTPATKCIVIHRSGRPGVAGDCGCPQ